MRSTECCSSSAACTTSASASSRTSDGGQCGAPKASIISSAVWLNGSLQRPWHVTRLPTQHTKAGDSPTTVAACSDEEQKRQHKCWVFSRAVPAANSDSILLVDGAYATMKIVLASITAETQCGSDAALLYIFSRSTAALSSRLNGGRSDSAAAERPPGQMAAQAAMITAT